MTMMMTTSFRLWTVFAVFHLAITMTETRSERKSTNKNRRTTTIPTTTPKTIADCDEMMSPTTTCELGLLLQMQNKTKPSRTYGRINTTSGTAPDQILLSSATTTSTMITTTTMLEFTGTGPFATTTIETLATKIRKSVDKNKEGTKTMHPMNWRNKLRTKKSRTDKISTISTSNHTSRPPPPSTDFPHKRNSSKGDRSSTRTHSKVPSRSNNLAERVVPPAATSCGASSSCDMLNCKPVQAEACNGRVVKDECNCCPVCDDVDTTTDNKQSNVAVTETSYQLVTGTACDKMVCPRNKVCILNIQGIPMCRCPNIYSCKVADKGPICSTDNKTFKNKCYLKTEECSTGMRIRIAHRGPCMGRITVTPPTALTNIDGEEWTPTKAAETTAALPLFLGRNKPADERQTVPPKERLNKTRRKQQRRRYEANRQER